MVRVNKDKEISMEQIDEIVRLVTMDIGSFNIKLNLTDEIYQNRFVLDNECDDPMSERLIYNDNTYVFGRGKFDLTYGKAFKNIEVPVLYGLGKQKVQGAINLILHLPTSQMPNKQMLIEKLQGKTLKYRVNNDKKDRMVILKTVGVLKEGFSSFYALAKRSKGMICIIDIGGRSTDVFCFIDGVLVKEKSISIGTIDYFEKLSEQFTIKTGGTCEVEDIHPKLQHDALNLEDEGYKEITSVIFGEIQNQIQKVDSLDGYEIKLCGGGSEYFESNFQQFYTENKVSVMDNSITSNVDGAENIGKAKGLDK